MTCVHHFYFYYMRFRKKVKQSAKTLQLDASSPKQLFGIVHINAQY